MKFDIDFHYFISYVPYRHQNTQSARAGASTTVEVREIDSADAPVVMLVGNSPDADHPYDSKFLRYAVKEDGSPRQIRYFEGCHFVERYSVERFKTDMEEGFSKTMLGMAKAYDNSYAPGNQYNNRLKTLTEIQRKAGDPLRSYTDDGGSSTAEKLKQLAQLIIVVDGVVFEYTPEPILTIGHHYDNFRVLIEPRPSAFVRYGSVMRDFHTSETFKSYKSALKHAHTILPLAPACETVPYFEVLDPTKSTFDGATEDTSGMIEGLERQLRAKAVGLPWNLLEAEFELRDAVVDAAGRVTPRVLAAVQVISEMEDGSDQAHTEAVFHYSNPDLQSHWNRDKNDVFSQRSAFINEGSFLAKQTLAKRILERWAHRPEDAYWDIDVGSVSSVVERGRTTAEELSEGRVVDYSRLIGIDPSEALTALADGKKIVVSSIARPDTASLSMAVMSDDGSFTILGDRNGFDFSMIFANYAAVVSAAREDEQMFVGVSSLTGGF